MLSYLSLQSLPQIAINALWLFPIRLFFILLPSLILGTLSTLGEPFDPDNPVPRARWRRYDNYSSLGGSCSREGGRAGDKIIWMSLSEYYWGVDGTVWRFCVVYFLMVMAAILEGKLY